MEYESWNYTVWVPPLCEGEFSPISRIPDSDSSQVIETIVQVLYLFVQRAFITIIDVQVVRCHGWEVRVGKAALPYQRMFNHSDGPRGENKSECKRICVHLMSWMWKFTLWFVVLASCIRAWVWDHDGLRHSLFSGKWISVTVVSQRLIH